MKCASIEQLVGGLAWILTCCKVLIIGKQDTNKTSKAFQHGKHGHSFARSSTWLNKQIPHLAFRLKLDLF